MREIPVWRRFVIACTAIGAAGWIVRGQVAGALVARGDEFLYRSDARAALGYYRRALRINPDDALAIDRYLFDATALHDRPAIEDAIALAGPYLGKHPQDDVVLLDRAMALRVLGRLSAAMDDFARAGTRSRDPRALVFAGLQARALGRPERARRFWQQALALDPHFRVARRLLERTVRTP